MKTAYNVEVIKSCIQHDMQLYTVRFFSENFRPVICAIVAFLLRNL